jgi:hypothetical protein
VLSKIVCDSVHGINNECEVAVCTTASTSVKMVFEFVGPVTALASGGGEFYQLHPRVMHSRLH